MTTMRTLFILLMAGAAWAQSQTASLRGQVTDPSGATVPGALVQLRGQGPEQRAYTNMSGEFSFTGLRTGKYQVRVIAKGFTVSEQKNFTIEGAAALNVQLTIEAGTQVINVEDEAGRVSIEAGENAGALVLGQKELATLSDDPDELAQQLQAMAGPSTGPNGGQIYIDGFSGGNLPPKASIREVRINSNPYSTEYDRPGFGRIEILTRPGGDKLRGQAFFMYNNQNLNSRSPLLTQSTRPPYSQRFFGFHLNGPVQKQKASFGFDLERRSIDENQFILATTLDSALQPQSVNQVLVAPQTRTSLSPRLDYAINKDNTLVVRYQYGRSGQDNAGVGNYALASRAYNQASTDHSIQATETAILSPRAINEVRFQFMRTALNRTGDNSTPALSVQGAFDGGGPQIGNSGNTSRRFEVSNMTTLTAGTHAFKFGARARRSSLDDLSVANFGGAYSFFGGLGPLLDASNQAIAGTSEQLTALERYRRTLLFQQMGYTAALIRTLGGGASQFSLAAGTPLASISQFDIGLYFNDDWRLRRNLTFSYGLRYETQTNIHDWQNWAPRFGLAWGLDGRKSGVTKTVLRVGGGVFYDRIGENLSLQALRYNGVMQQSYFIQNPDFFPVIPSVAALAAGLRPQQLTVKDATLEAPRNYQSSVSLERTLNKYAKLSVQYVTSRGVHMQRTRNINAPAGGVYPFGDQQVRVLDEATGFSRTNQLVVSPNVNYKKLFLFGFYSLSYGKTDAEGMPADPYNLRSEWGPSGFGDVRHRAVIGTSVPLPWKISMSPFMMVQGGSPYNITTGRDTNGDGFTSERPALLPDLTAAACTGGSFVYTAQFGCFNLAPAPGTAIKRNYGRGPANLLLNLRLARSWAFGKIGETNPIEAGGPGGPPPGGPGGGMRGGPGGGMRGGGGPPPGMGGPGGPGGMFGQPSIKKYNLTLTVSAHNIINRANYASPGGDLSSPFFGTYRSLMGGEPIGRAGTYNRKVDIQLRFTF